MELVNLNLAEESMFVETSCVPIVVVLCLCRHFNTDSLICDCNLKWVLQWARNASVRIAEETVCAYPSALHGLSLYNLKENQLICGELYSDLALKIEGESKENTKKPKPKKPKKPQKHRKQTKPDRYVAQKIHLRMKKSRKKIEISYSMSQEHHCSAMYSIIRDYDIKHLTMLLGLHCILYETEDSYRSLYNVSFKLYV